jgi:hypothetical protein
MTIVGFSVRNGEKMHFEKRKIALFAIVVLSVVFVAYSLVLIWQALSDANEIVRVEEQSSSRPIIVDSPAPAQQAALEQNASQENTSATEEWSGATLNAYNGVVQGPSGRETYYNLPMGGVIAIMESAGFYADYWVRDDGVKMYGDYIMVAADQSIRPLGSLVETSLGTAIVCDTGSFIYNDPYQLDIAVVW